MYVKNLPGYLAVVKKGGDEEVPCKICEAKFKIKNMRNHVGRHILWALRGQTEPLIDNQVSGKSHQCTNDLLSCLGWR
jgi:hypothetical protein